MKAATDSETTTDNRHLQQIEFNPRKFQKLRDRSSGGKQRGQPIRLGFVVNVVDTDDLAGARHVLNDDCRVARNVPR